MAPHKCNYMIFTKRIDPSDKSFQFRLYNKPISYSEECTFLGIRLDPHFNLNNQIKYLIETSNKRLNIIRILSHKSWSLDKKTLIQVYNTLIRSLFDYSCIFSSMLSKTSLNKIQVIQNNALRSILKKNTMISINELHSTANINTIDERLKHLSKKYIEKNLANNNPIISSTIDEFINFKQARILKYKTLLCDIFIES